MLLSCNGDTRAYTAVQFTVRRITKGSSKAVSDCRGQRVVAVETVVT